ncbi:SH3 domain-containing protein [Mariniblastus fucicola]|nr:hypothetical protein [Mariniblastus fucicola]
MRNLILVAFAAAMFFVCSANANGQEYSLLYTAIVKNDDASVHSGPGKSHYATHRLNRDELVQVYRRDPGGWCLIRPPERSFSLIPRSAVKLLSDEVGEIKIDGVDAWVGTKLGPVENPMSQKSLKKGDRVAIVGEVSWPNPAGKPNVWLQIEPPSGEYRWIHVSNLQLPPEKDTRTESPSTKRELHDDESLDSEPSQQRSSPRSLSRASQNQDATENSPTERDYSEPPSFSKSKSDLRTSFAKGASSSQARTRNSKRKIATKEIGSGWKSATRPIPEVDPVPPQFSANFASPNRNPNDIRVSDPDSGFVEQATFVQEAAADSRFEPWDGRPVSALSQPARAPDRFASRDSMDRQVRSYVRDQSQSNLATNRTRDDGFEKLRENSTLIEIEDRLSKEMVKEPGSWNLADLKFATERAKARSVDPVERLAFQHVMDKIERCDQLRKHYQQASPYPAASSSIGSARSGTSTAGTPYDAVGWLKRLANSSGRVDPTYVLQDSLGNVTHEVVGIAGMNLGQYVDKQVGVIGRRGFNRRLKLNHVTAERIVVR